MVDNRAMSRASTAIDRPRDPSRRRVIFTGIAGAAALALARLLQPIPVPRSVAAGALSADGADVMRALLPAFLDGALPREAHARTAAVEETVVAVASAIDGLPPIAQHELGALFALLALTPVRVALAGVESPWREADVESANAFLERLRESRWSQKRAAYDALHQLAFGAWYASPRAWPATGYPGPPDLG
jgi:hypothetical protein